ncbi:MAG: DUF3987 domain-containing protein, partial [Burkholderiales bacterium]|nr:DUF3987 domain-containing protein [Burkholderiales bacterium]
MTAVAPLTVTARPALGKVGGLGADDVLDVEQALLGALLLNNHAFEHVAGLAEDAFSEPLNRAIFRAIRREIEAGGVADITTVGEALRGAGYGASSIAYLARLAANVPSAARAALYAAKVRERAIGDWPEPQPLPEVPPVAPFEDKFLPPLLRAFVADIAERMQCPPDFPAVAALAMIGAAIGRRVTIRPCRRGDWAVVPNLWAMLVGRPGVLKSPAAAEALAPLRSLQDLAFETYRTALEEYEIARRAAKIEADERERQARKALREGRASAREILGAAQEPEPPRALRFIVADATVEALAEILEENPNGVLLVRDELSGWLREL